MSKTFSFLFFKKQTLYIDHGSVNITKHERPHQIIYILTTISWNYDFFQLKLQIPFPPNYDLGRRASNGPCATAAVDPHGLMGIERWWVGPTIWIGRASTGVDADADAADGGTATRSHDGHMVRVVGGVICM